jgi:hypothetical protein
MRTVIENDEDDSGSNIDSADDAKMTMPIAAFEILPKELWWCRLQRRNWTSQTLGCTPH